LQSEWNVAGKTCPPYISSEHGRRNKTLARVSLLALCSVLVAGCNQAHGPDVMATVNGKPIMRSEVETLYKINQGEAQQQAPSKEQADIVRMQIIQELIDQEIVQQRAAKLNLVASDEEVTTKLAEFKAPYTQEEFDKKLTSEGSTLDQLKQRIRRNLTEEKLLNKEINSKINITDADISNFYNANKAQFNLIEPQYHLAQILVTPVPAQQQQQAGNLQNSKATNDTEAKKKIQTLHNRLESGEDFGLLATNFSEDPNTSGSGGDLGLIQESQLRSRPDAFAAIGKLKPGQITDVMPLMPPGAKTPAAYAIYKLVDKQAAGQRDLNDPRVQQFIRKQLRDARSQLMKNAYLEMLRDQAKVQDYFAEEIFKRNAQ
jgi:peptidyl-prolyl cis-trans isomerase SurA